MDGVIDDFGIREAIISLSMKSFVAISNHYQSFLLRSLAFLEFLRFEVGQSQNQQFLAGCLHFS